MGLSPELWEICVLTACVSMNNKHLEDSESCLYAKRESIVACDYRNIENTESGLLMIS